MIRVKLTLQMLQMLLHTNPSHQDEPFQTNQYVVKKMFYRYLKQISLLHCSFQTDCSVYELLYIQVLYFHGHN